MRKLLLTILLVAVGYSVVVSCTSGTSGQKPDPRIREGTAPEVTPEPGYSSSSGAVKETAEKKETDPEKAETDDSQKNQEAGSKRTSDSVDNGTGEEPENGSGNNTSAPIEHREKEESPRNFVLRLLEGSFKTVPFRFRKNELGGWVRYRIKQTNDDENDLGYVEYSFVGTDGDFRWIEKSYRIEDREAVYRYLVDRQGHVHQVYRKRGTSGSVVQEDSPEETISFTLLETGQVEETRQFRNGDIRIFKGTLELIGEEQKQSVPCRLSRGLPVSFPGTSSGPVQLRVGEIKMILEDFGTETRKKVSLPY